jgi:uncharacterized coiled-coil protein SlyX
MLIREMTISDADFIWRHPHLYTGQEVALASTVLNLADEYGLAEGEPTLEEVKAERDDLQGRYDCVCQQIDRLDEIVAEQDAKIDSLECKLADKDDAITKLAVFIREKLGEMGFREAVSKCTDRGYLL